MTTLEKITLLASPYKSFEKHCKDAAKAEMATGAYPQLSYNRLPKSCNSRPVSEYRAYIHFIARPASLEQTGRRNMNHGHLEVIVEVKAPFHDEENYQKGMNVSPAESPLRLCIGPNLGALCGLTEPMIKEWHFREPSLLSALESGNYGLYVKSVLTMVNASIERFKLLATSSILERRVVNGVLILA